MAAHYDEIGTDGFSLGVYLDLGTAQHYMLMLTVDIMGFTKTFELLDSLLMDLILDARKVHWNITTIGKAQWLYYMDEVQLGAVVGCKTAGSLRYKGRLFT